MRLPAPACDPPQPLNDDDAAPSLEGLRVLAAEDNPTNQIVLRIMLETAGVELSLVDDGERVLQALAGGDFDLVLMDIHMPRMDGREALRRIRSGEAGSCDIPVIALTADAMKDDCADLVAAGLRRLRRQAHPPRRAVLRPRPRLPHGGCRANEGRGGVGSFSSAAEPTLLPWGEGEGPAARRRGGRDEG
ncbi:MAG: response regulator [Caulobacteraceae bacterium]